MASVVSLQEFSWIGGEGPQEWADARIEKVQEVAGSLLQPGQQLRPQELKGANEGEVEADRDVSRLERQKQRGNETDKAIQSTKLRQRKGPRRKRTVKAARQPSPGNRR